MLGQYFTKNVELQEKVFEFIKNKPDVILEPSFGRGDLVKYISEKSNAVFDLYEIDEKIEKLSGLKYEKLEYCDFLKKKISKKYKTIVGNPPYVKTKKSNLYIDFIKKCAAMLENSGELIFIIPSDFFKLTMARKLLKSMLSQGSFTHIYHPNKENLFEGASIDVLVFRYEKSQTSKKVLYTTEKTRELYITNSDGLITFTEQDQSDMKTIGELFDVYVGMVSGKESVFRNKMGNIDLLCGDVVRKYIFVDKIESNAIGDYLKQHKDVLMKRRIKKFNENNWFEWGAPRNRKVMEEHKGEDCIYVYNLTRKPVIAFKGKIQYFGGNLIMLKPKKKNIIPETLKYLNGDAFKKIFTYSNRFKIGHRQLRQSYIANV